MDFKTHPHQAFRSLVRTMTSQATQECYYCTVNLERTWIADEAGRVEPGPVPPCSVCGDRGEFLNIQAMTSSVCQVWIMWMTSVQDEHDLFMEMFSIVSDWNIQLTSDAFNKVKETHADMISEEAAKLVAELEGNFESEDQVTVSAAALTEDELRDLGVID